MPMPRMYGLRSPTEMTGSAKRASVVRLPAAEKTLAEST
jgi:hypothetical protein